MYVSFRKYKTTKEGRKKMMELRSARYISAGEISSRNPSERLQDRKKVIKMPLLFSTESDSNFGYK